MEKKQYMFIVRRNICIFRPLTDDDLKIMNGLYPSPIFLWDGTLASLDAIFDDYEIYFAHFLDWSAIVIPV